MAEYSTRKGYDAPTSAGDGTADNIRSKEIKDLEKDLWTACWGPGKSLSNMFQGTAAQKNEGLDYSASSGGTSMGVVSGNPASYNDATGVTASDPTDSTGGNQDFDSGDSHDATTSSINRDHIRALQVRLNELMKATGQSSGGTHANIDYLDEVTKHGALRGSNDSTPVTRGNDLSRVRPAHLDAISAEIENMRTTQYPGKWTYMSYDTNSGGNSFNHIQSSRTRSVTNLDWGEWNWSVSGTWYQGNDGYPWSDAGSQNWYRNYPFIEHGFRFTDFAHLRKFFNRGGKLWVRIEADDGYEGHNTWYNITGRENFYATLGVATTLEDITPSTTSINQIPANVTCMTSGTLHNLGGWDATATCPRIYDVMDQANFSYSSGTPSAGGGATIGKCSVGSSSTQGECVANGGIWNPLIVTNHDGNWSNVSSGDIVTIDNYEGEVDSVSGNEITLKRKMRNSSGTEVESLSNKAYNISKWYRYLAMRGDAGLYGGTHSEGTPEGYAFYDVRIAHETSTTSNIDVFVRGMMDNSMNEMTMEAQTIEMYCGFMRRNGGTYIESSGNPTGFISYASAEDANQGVAQWASGATAEKYRVGGVGP